MVALWTTFIVRDGAQTGGGEEEGRVYLKRGGVDTAYLPSLHSI